MPISFEILPEINQIQRLLQNGHLLPYLTQLKQINPADERLLLHFNNACHHIHFSKRQ